MYFGTVDRPQEKIKLLSSPTSAVFEPGDDPASGHLLWVRDDGALVTQTFDPGRAQITGEPSIVAAGLAFNLGTRRAHVSVSSAGVLLYVKGGTTTRHQLTWYGRDGRQAGVLGEPDVYYGLRIAPDGKRVAVLGGAGGLRCLADRVRSWYSSPRRVWRQQRRLVSRQPIRSYTPGAPLRTCFSRSVNSASPEERLTTSHDTQVPQDWSLDGRYLLYQTLSNDLASKMRADLWFVPMAGGRKPAPLHGDIASRGTRPVFARWKVDRLFVR